MKIVVCDDDALVYEQMKNIIASYSIVKNENLELTFYQTVEELLHAKHKYDILFLDIRFNNCDIGIDVAKKLRKAGNTSAEALRGRSDPLPGRPEPVFRGNAGPVDCRSGNGGAAGERGIRRAAPQ